MMSKALSTLAEDMSLESVKALIETAQARRYSDTPHALSEAEQAFSAAQELGSTPLLLDSLKELAICSHVLNDYPKTVSWGEILLREAIAASSLERQANGHNLIGIGHYDVGNLDTALSHFQNALALYEQIDLKSGIAVMCLNIGNVYHIKGEFETALFWFQRSMELQSTSSNVQQIRLLNSIGLTHYHLGRHPNAIEFLTESLRKAEAETFKTMQSTALGNIVDVYLDYGDYTAALNYCLKALALAEQMNDQKQLAGKKLQLGIVYSKMGDNAVALAQTLQAFSLAEHIGAAYHLINILARLGSLYAALDEPDKAEASFKQGRQKATDSGYKFFEARLLLSYSDFLAAQSRSADALNVLTHGLQLCEQLDVKNLKSRFHERLSSLYKSLGDFSKSARHLQLSEKLNAQFASGDSTRQLLVDFEAQRFLKEHLQPSKADFETSLALARKAIEQKHLGLVKRRVDTVSSEPRKATVLVKTFGEFVVTVNGITLSKDDWQRKKARNIFKILLIHHRNAVTTDELIELLWDGNIEKNVEQVIKNSVSFIRKAIEPDLAPREPSAFLRTEGKSYTLDLGDDDSIDFLQFKSLIRQATHDTLQRESLYEKAVALYAGDFLKEDLYEDWTTTERELLKDAYISALAALADAAYHKQDIDATIRWSRDLVATDRTHDKGYEILIKTLYECGHLAEARRVFAQCKEAFKKELDLPLPKQLQKFFPDLA